MPISINRETLVLALKIRRGPQNLITLLAHFNYKINTVWAKYIKLSQNKVISYKLISYFFADNETCNVPLRACNQMISSRWLMPKKLLHVMSCFPVASKMGYNVNKT